nr:MAG TPA: minor capsid component [Caudoviricetes sp.]
MLEGFLHKIYDGFDISNDIEPTAWREVLRIMNSGAVQGLSESINPPTHEEGFLRSIRHSNEVFSVFKTHAMGTKMAERLIGEDGKLRSFEEWRKAVAPIARHQVGSWLRTEYDTAVIRAHQAADWLEFEANKDIFPNLQWMPTTSVSPESSHQVFWSKPVILPVDDPFWQEHRPGDRWNCKCSLDTTDADVQRLDPQERKEAAKPEHQAQRGLEGNPAYKGLITDKHPYYPESCAKCPFYSSKGIKGWVRKHLSNRVKDCHNCPYVDKVIHETSVKPPLSETYIEVEGYEGKVYVSPHHRKTELDENVRVAKILTEALGEKVYLLPYVDPSDKDAKSRRAILHPPGVFERKNPDYLIGGRLFDAKVMEDKPEILDAKQQKGKLHNKISAAKEQATHFAIEIPSNYDMKIVTAHVNDYLERSSKERIIVIIQNGKAHVFETKKGKP